MPLTKLTGFTKKIGDLPDKPTPGSMTAAELKAYYDSSPEELRLAFNKLIDDLQVIVDGGSGADNIGVTSIAGLTGGTVQSLLEALKVSDDENRAYLLAQIQGAVVGQIPDGTITDVKLSNDPADIKQGFAAHKADYLKHTGYAVATGSANAYVATLNPALSAYAEGVSLRLKVNVANTGASTVNVNGLGTKAIKKSNGNDVASGNLKAGSVYTLAYDGTSFILQGEGGEYGTAVASDVLTGKTIGTEDGIVSGTLTPGKRYLTGTATSSASTSQFVLLSGASTGRYSITVTGLPFVPKAISLIYVVNAEIRQTIYRESVLGPYPKTAYLFPPINTSAGSTTIAAQAFKADIAPGNVSTNFTLPVEFANLVYTWEVWE